MAQSNKKKNNPVQKPVPVANNGVSFGGVESLPQSEQRFRTLVRASSQVEYRMNPDWTELRYLEGREFIADTKVPSKTWLDTYIHPDDQARVKAAIANAIRTRNVFQMEHRVLNKDGSVSWTASWATPIFDEDGNITEWFGMASDITERKQTEKALRNFNTELERRVEKRTAELSQRARQLRTLAWTLTLAEERERRRIADVLHDNQQQLLAAAKLSLASLETSGDKPAKQMAARAEALIDQAIECARSLTEELNPPVLYHGGLVPAIEWLGGWMEAKHGVNIRFDADPDAEPETEKTRVLLFRCARELLFNAVKHADVNDVEIRLHDRNRQTEITVSDRGAGFDPQDLNGETNTVAGFGLFAIRERMELLGGELEIRSAPGRGSHFTVRVPHAAGIPPEAD